MRCEDLAARLTDFLEGDLDPETELAAAEHLASCERCETVLRETRSVVALMADVGRTRLTDAERVTVLGRVHRRLDAAG